MCRVFQIGGRLFFSFNELEVLKVLITVPKSYVSESGFKSGSNDSAHQDLFTVPGKLIQSDRIFEMGIEE